MTILVEVRVPPDALALGCVFDEHPEATVEVDRIVPIDDDLMPYFWLSNDGGDFETPAATIRDHTDTKSLTKLTETERRALFQVVWEPSVDQAVSALRENHCGCIEVAGTSDGWDMRLRFSDREDVMAFNETLTTKGVPVTLQRLNDMEGSDATTPITPEQREALRRAHQAGYFHVPRESSIEELANDTGISNSAFSERLRRGLDRLIERTDFETATPEL